MVDVAPEPQLGPSETPDWMQLDLTVEVKDAERSRALVERALEKRGVRYELWGSSATELRYEVSVPIAKKLRRLTKAITGTLKRHAVVVDWRLKKRQTVQTQSQ